MRCRRHNDCACRCAPAAAASTCRTRLRSWSTKPGANSVSTALPERQRKSSPVSPPCLQAPLHCTKQNRGTQNKNKRFPTLKLSLLASALLVAVPFAASAPAGISYTYVQGCYVAPKTAGGAATVGAVEGPDRTNN